MTGGFPDFSLLECVDTCSRIALLVVPDGFDFYEDDRFVDFSDNVEFTTLIGVIAGNNLITFAPEICCGKAFNEVSFGTVACFAFFSF